MSTVFVRQAEEPSIAAAARAPRRAASSILSTLTAIAAACVLSACGSDDDVGAAPVALPSKIDLGAFIPEDLVVRGDTAYVSSLIDASIYRVDLKQGGAVSRFAPAQAAPYTAGWGVKVHEQRQWLLSLQNQPYDFAPQNARTGRLVAYGLSTGAVDRTWTLPDGMVGNSVVVDGQGMIFVGDIGPEPRIVRIDPATGTVSVWAADAAWKRGSFGIGGMAVVGNSLYASHDNRLWHIGRNADGSAAAAQPVSVEGDPVIFADGMTAAGASLYYAENDLFTPGAKGVAYRIDFTAPTRAVRSVVATGLFDPSGIAVATQGGKDYLLINESRLGFAVGTEQGSAPGPYQLAVVPKP